MTAAVSLDRRQLTRAEQVEHLRRKIAAVSGKVGAGRRGAASSADQLPASETLLPMPETLAELSHAPLPRGTVAVVTGARSLLLSMVAAVTAGGGHAAIVGQPDVGLLAAVEMGADLSRIAVVPEAGANPVEVAAVLMDGMDLVVLGLRGRSVPATRARAVVARPGRRDAPCWSPAATGRGRRSGWRPGCAATRSRVRVARGSAASAGCDWPCGPGAVFRFRARSGRMSVLARSRHLVHGLAGRRRSGSGGPTVDRPDRGDAGQPGHRLFGVGPIGGCAAGLRRREAQARCPELHVATADPARDARHFEGVTLAVDDLVPRAEVLRPGLLVLPVRGRPATSGPNKPPLSGWSTQWPLREPNAR